MAKRQFYFLNTSNSVTPVLKQILEFTGNNLPAGAHADKILFKAKIIVTELLTNSLKHSGSNDTLIDVDITNNNIAITKTDQGNPLSLITGNNKPINQRIPVTNDILHTLYAEFKTEYQVKFFCEENNMDDILAIDDIVEHFGLLIITKSADDFNYVFEQASGKNIFNISLKPVRE